MGVGWGGVRVPSNQRAAEGRNLKIYLRTGVALVDGLGREQELGALLERHGGGLGWWRWKKKNYGGLCGGWVQLEWCGLCQYVSRPRAARHDGGEERKNRRRRPCVWRWIVAHVTTRSQRATKPRARSGSANTLPRATTKPFPS